MKTTIQQDVLLRRSLASLGTLTIIGLLGCALASVLLLLQIGQLILPILIVDIVLVVVAGLVATGIRWMPLLGAIDALGTMIGALVSQQYFSYHLTHPAQVGFFAAALLVYAFGIVTVGAGIAATVQNYRNRGRHAPRALVPLLSALAGFLLGAILVATLSQGSAGATASNGTSTVHMGVNTFTTSTVTISKGSKLSLVDDGSFLHILDNGEWVNNAPRTSREPGAPLVNNVQVNGNSTEIGPFNIAGTYHIYCTVHAGMNLTVIVQ